MMKKTLLGLFILAIILFIIVLAFAFWPTKTPPIATEPINSALVARGQYIAVASDCTACHTAPQGKLFAGGLGMASPIGTIYSTNITPDKQTGIGHYTLSDFDRAVRHGIRPDGLTLYPAMPYPSYVRLSDEDVRALYAYFMQGVSPVQAENRATGIPWPLSIRWPLNIWRKLFAPSVDVKFDAKQYPSPEIARGAYLVQASGHCGSCHTPRLLTMQEKTLTDYGSNGAHYLAGGQVIDGWFTSNLRADLATGLGSWSEKDIVDTLKTGRNQHHTVIGSPMNDVVIHSTQNMSDADLKAIAAYLKTLTPSKESKASYTADDAMAKALYAGKNPTHGAALYVDNCAGCHRSDGQGYARVFPSIANNPSVLSDNPISMIRLILTGSTLPQTHTAPSDLSMPGFAQRLSDDDVAQLATFIRQNFGNHASSVDSSQVHSVRKTLKQ
ncbi:cytochrome c [Aquirhabdus parva]|uniref:Cytochrome c n=1 Tax=Aquirhabdus parva TaxID=2283318 RepID=A0A345P5U2_9GAMM|nr:cytochrome c [Aquirhabdus parva]AXI02651.1 cytochrome c [Aquirhabdus parva]